MITQDQVHTLYGREVRDRNGAKVGTLGQIYGDAAVGLPTWGSVRTGLFGTNESLVPLQDAELQDGRLRVPFDKSEIKNAPNIDVALDEPLTTAEVDQLHAYYGGIDRGHTVEPHPRDAMIRSEERLTVGTQAATVGKARLRKYVVTEQRQITVPVTREEVRLEREPIAAANAKEPVTEPDIAGAEQDMILYEERPMVRKETVPVERIRLGKQSVTEHREVSGEIRKERVETEASGGVPRDK